MRFLLALLICLLLAGCGAEDLEDVSDSGWEEYQQQEEPVEVKDSYPAVFSLAYHKDHTLDPITCGEGIQQDVASLLYEPLFRLDGAFEPQYVLCESCDAGEDGLVYTLTIREGVLFSDGSELTAGDVAASLKRAQTSERYAYRLRNVSAVNYSNRKGTVTVTLLQPNTSFAALLDIPIVKKGTEDQLVPVGTGPYVFVTADSGPQLIANDDWWQKGSLPVQTITLVHAKDEDTALHLFASGRVELLTLDPTGGHTTVNGRNTETERPTAQMHFIGFNTACDFFADSAVRKAFSAGIERDVLVDVFLSNHALPASFPISPLSPLYPGEPSAAYTDEEIAAVLCGDGEEKRELILLVNEEDTFRVDNAEFIAEKLSFPTLTITVRALPWTEYLVALSQGDFDLYYGEVRLTADWDLTDLIGTGGLLNYGGYTDLWIDALLQAFSTTTDRAAVAGRLYGYFAETVPIAPICFQNYTVLTHENIVEGMTCAPDSTFYSLGNWTIHLAE